MKVAELVEGRKKRKKKPFMWMGIPFAIVQSGTGDDTIGSGAGFDGGLSEATKFVANAAARADVSIETAEHRWAEAKKAVKKGKRRGSWYWGKVMNTFKRMMGLMEDEINEATKADKPKPIRVLLAKWDKEIYIKGGYIAEMQPHDRAKTIFIIKELMGDEELGKAYIFQRAAGGSTYWWALHYANGVQVKVERAGAFEQQLFAEWLEPLVPKLRKSK